MRHDRPHLAPRPEGPPRRPRQRLRPLGTPRPAAPPAPARLGVRGLRPRRAPQVHPAGGCAVRCPDPPDWCLKDHIRPRLDGWTGGPRQFNARCPVHGGRKASLSIRVGDQARIIWHCQRQPPCPPAAVRAALVLRGVPDGCLPRVTGQRSEDELAAAIIAIYTTMPRGRASDLAVLAAVYGPPDSTAALAALGEQFGIARSTTYSVMDMSDGRTNVTDMRRIMLSGDRTPSPITGQPRDGFTSGFDGIRHTGVGNSVGPEDPPRVSATITRCKECERAITGRRADAEYCSRSCQQKAWRRAQGSLPRSSLRARQPGRRP